MLESTAITRELGAKLRESREKARLRSVEVARGLGWPQSKVSRLESGDRKTDPMDLAMYLGHCKLSQEDARPILALAKEVDTGIWPRLHHKQIPDRLLSLVMNESPATTICCYEPTLVPGLLQTRDYAAEVIRGLVPVAPEDVPPLVEARVVRQKLISRVNPPQMEFFIEEAVLIRPVGGPRVMNEQLLHLMFLASRPQTRVRVLPTSIGVHAAVNSPFAMMHYSDRQPVTWLEGRAVSVVVEDKDVMGTYRAIRSELRRVALDEEQSRALFARLASAYDVEHEAGEGVGIGM